MLILIIIIIIVVFIIIIIVFFLFCTDIEIKLEPSDDEGMIDSSLFHS